MLVVKLLSHFPIGSNFFKELIASYSVGAGRQAFQEKRYSEAYKILKPIADYDIDDTYVGSCQYILGVMYYHGLGVDKDIDIGIKYLKYAKERDNEDASVFLQKVISANES